jgi:hypothetical protein
MKEFEKQVAKALLEAAGLKALFDILTSATNEEFDYTKVGYYLTVKHPSLPVERYVLCEPFLLGRTEGVPPVNFLAFIEDHEFMLECVAIPETLGDVYIPEDFRDRKVEIIIAEVTRV